VQVFFRSSEYADQAELVVDASQIAWDTIYRVADKKVVKILGLFVKKT
jgi:hypothetical protein